MANLSGYTPIYIRTNGNDITGNGSLANPFATAQKAFEYAYGGSYGYGGGGGGSYVLDFGVGNFGGVDLKLAAATDWPSRIAVRGVNYTDSLMGGINGDGVNEVVDLDTYITISNATNGLNITIISNETINIGNISANGASSLNGNGSTAGDITITDGYCLNISAAGGYSENFIAGGGGNITLNNSKASNINSSSGNSNGTIGSNLAAGSVVLIRSKCNNITSNAGNSQFGIAFVDPPIGNTGGSISLYNSQCNNIVSRGYSSFGGNGGAVLLKNSLAVSVNISKDMSFLNSNHGLLTLTGYSIMPLSIQGNIDMSNMFQGYCANGMIAIA